MSPTNTAPTGAAQVEKVRMRSPEDGKTYEIEGRHEVLVPYMAKGWVQVSAAEAQAVTKGAV